LNRSSRYISIKAVLVKAALARDEERASKLISLLAFEYVRWTLASLAFSLTIVVSAKISLRLLLGLVFLAGSFYGITLEATTACCYFSFILSSFSISLNVKE
jgi:hypothetical protein